MLLSGDYMDGKEIESILKDLETVTRGLNQVQREVTRGIVEKITSIQRFIDQMPVEEADDAPKEVIIQENRIVIRQNGQTIYEGLY
jgi:hypothetical protein